MPVAAWSIAGRRVPVPDAVDYLMRGYPTLTLRYYDGGGESPRDSITMSDLGRATLFGAFRGWKTAASMLRASEAACWPTDKGSWRLDAAPAAEPEGWVARSEVGEARELFSSLASGDEGGWREAATSKILHLKWPAFFPVIDGELRTLYSRLALEAERRIPGSRRRRHASTTAYWIAVRQELLLPENVDAESATRESLSAASDRERSALLTQLTSLRLLDALAWAVASRGLRAHEGRRP